MSEIDCPSTMGYAREGIRCTRALGHIGRHSGKGWVWWRGNGETDVPEPDPAEVTR